MKFATCTVTCTGTNAIVGDRRLSMEGPTGGHSVLMRDQMTDESLGLRYGRAAVHLIGYLQRNHVSITEVGRAVTHVLQDTIDSFYFSDAFVHGEFRRGLLAAWGIGIVGRKGAKTHARVGYRAGKALRSFIELPV